MFFFTPSFPVCHRASNRGEEWWDSRDDGEEKSKDDSVQQALRATSPDASRAIHRGAEDSRGDDAKKKQNLYIRQYVLTYWVVTFERKVWGWIYHRYIGTFPTGTSGKESASNAEDKREVVSVPGSGRYPGEENSNHLQYSCLENSMDRGAWWATVHGVAKSWT